MTLTNNLEYIRATPHNSRLAASEPLRPLWHRICVAKMLANVGLRYPHRASGAKAPRTLRPLPLLRFAVSATGGAHLCSIQYYLRFWLSSCRTSLAVSVLRIMRYCLKSCLCLRNIRHFLWLQIHLNLSGQWRVLRPAGRLRAGRGSHISSARPPRNLPAHRAQ